MRTSLLASFILMCAAVNASAQCDPALVVPSDGTAIPTPVIISEVNPGVGGYIELFNPTAAGVNMTGWWLCSPFSYSPVGAVIVAAGSYITVPWPAGFSDTDAGGEIMLYDSSNFGNSGDIIDYVPWGASNGFRLSQVVLPGGNGKWSGAFPPALVNGAIHRITGTTGTNAASYDVTSAPSPMNCTPTVTGIGDTPAYPSISLSVGPNPFSALATIEFELSSPANVTASVYSVTGARVRKIDSAAFARGAGRMLWDGKDDAGRELPSGTYLLKVSANNSSATQRVTILR